MSKVQTKYVITYPNGSTAEFYDRDTAYQKFNEHVEHLTKMQVFVEPVPDLWMVDTCRESLGYYFYAPPGWEPPPQMVFALRMATGKDITFTKR